MDMGKVKMDRRRFGMGMISGITGATSVLGAESPAVPGTHDQMPTMFVAHGSPQSTDDVKWMSSLQTWAKKMPKPKAILMISAHWVNRPITLGATRSVPLTYDFYGFPKRHYSVKYNAPGAPELARRVQELLSQSDKIANAADRGLDHGAYVPLLGMYPDAETPVLQISIPTMEPAPLIELGRKLTPLRREGVLIVGSGFLIHNLGALDFSPSPQTPAWAIEFDAWAAEALRNRNTADLIRYREKAPGVKLALPTHEHFVPVLVALGASLEMSDQVSFPLTGFMGGSLTQRSVQFG